MILNPHVKLALDVLPVAIFFVFFKCFDLFAATAAMLALTVVSLAVVYIAERRIAIAPLLTAAVVGIFGGLTLWLHDETFIKIKPTLINLLFAVILLGGCLVGKGLMRHVFGAAFHLTERGWFLLSRRWGLFFLCMAGLNEYVWRHYPTPVWVNFKVFGLIGLTMLFAALQARLIAHHQEADHQERDDS